MDCTCTLEEIITVDLARTLKDGEVGFTGLATGEKASMYVSRIPIAAMELAKRTHAPNLTTLLSGWIFNPDWSKVKRFPESEFDNETMNIPCESHTTMYPGNWSHKVGDIDFGFGSGAQVDKYGNINSTCIGPFKKPNVQLVGPILLPEHCALFGREYIMMPYHEKRNFVEEVDYVSGVGFPQGVQTRKNLGLKGGGPQYIYTPKCIFAFNEDGEIYVKSIHPGISKEDVIENTGFKIGCLDSVPRTKLPTNKELRILREVVDPNGIFFPKHNIDKDHRTT